MPTVQVQGRRTYFHDGGVPWSDGRPGLVFLHGAGADHTVRQQQSRALAQGNAQLPGFNVAVLDLPGHGRSEDAQGLDSVEAHAEWLAAFLDAAGLERAALVGHSLGACIAVALAAQRPERVTALALVGGGLRMKVSATLLRDSAEDQPQAVRFMTAYGHARPTHLGHAPTPGHWIMGSATALLLAGTPEVLHRDFALCDAWDGTAAAAAVRCPTLVVSGEGDRMTPPQLGQGLADAIAGARFALVPGAGHMVPSEAPRPLLKLLRAFLAG